MPHLSFLKGSGDEKGYAAIFVDFENVFYYMRNQYADLPDLTEYTLELLRNLRNYMEQELNLQPIVRFAYADFERLASAPLGSLYLMGIEIRNVLGAQHKNAADMRLCIDAMQVLYTRPDIRTFVFVAGDRDYIPVIQHIQTQARTVKAVAFRGNLSGDLLQNIGDENFIDALTLLDEESLKRLESEAAYARERERILEERRRVEQEEREKQGRTAATEVLPKQEGTPVSAITKTASTAVVQADQRSDVPSKSPNSGATEKEVKSVPVPFAKPVALMTDDQRFCIAFLLKEYGNYPEIYIGPFLHRLTDAMPHLADYERKSILHDLEQFGAIRVESRRGEPHDYRVIIINYNHPDVRELNPG
ncbi:MAG: NYN domain-containing protein [Bacteroidetes bacterium]|nr:NYN domain-containing protein [Bacteroidota bacterium]